jgi:hypothetical protein
VGKFGEKALDEVEPGAMRGGEGELEAASRSSGEPASGLFGYVCGMIVEDQLDRRAGRVGSVKKLEEFDELSADDARQPFARQQRTTVSHGRRAAFAPAPPDAPLRFGSARRLPAFQFRRRSSPIRPLGAILPCRISSFHQAQTRNPQTSPRFHDCQFHGIGRPPRKSGMSFLFIAQVSRH